MSSSELMDRNICDLIDDDYGLDIGRVKDSSVPELVVSGSNSNDQFNEQGQIFRIHKAVMEPAWKLLQDAAANHLQTVISNLVEEKEEALRLQQAIHKENVDSLKSNIQTLESKLKQADDRYRKLQDMYYHRGERLAAVCNSSSTASCRQSKLLAKYLGSWKQMCADQKNSRQLDHLAATFNEKSQKEHHFHHMARIQIRNKCERERDDIVRHIDSTARRALEKFEIEIDEWKTRALAAEQKVLAAQAARLKLEEDMKRLLLKNMASINIEALSVFHQHVFPEGIEEERSFFPVVSESATERLLHCANSLNIDPGSTRVQGNSTSDSSIAEVDTRDETGVKTETTLILTRLLQLQQAELKRQTNYMPSPEALSGDVKKVVQQYEPLDANSDSDSPRSIAPVPVTSTVTESVQSGSTRIQVVQRIEKDDLKPRERVPVPLAINVGVGIGTKLSQPPLVTTSTHDRAWRGAGAVGAGFGTKSSTQRQRGSSLDSRRSSR